jgi:hypothetical protein
LQVIRPLTAQKRPIFELFVEEIIHEPGGLTIDAMAG